MAGMAICLLVVTRRDGSGGASVMMVAWFRVQPARDYLGLRELFCFYFTIDTILFNKDFQLYTRSYFIFYNCYTASKETHKNTYAYTTARRTRSRATTPSTPSSVTTPSQWTT